MNRPATVGWCTGKDCRKLAEHRALRKQLEDHCNVLELPCLDYCKGAVLALDPRGAKPMVLGRVRAKGLNDVIRHVAEGAPLSGRLKKRCLTGSDRARARRRIAKALR